MSAYFMPPDLFAWLNAHVGHQIYVRIKDGREFVGIVQPDSAVGTVALQPPSGSWRTVIHELDITGVEPA